MSVYLYAITEKSESPKTFGISGLYGNEVYGISYLNISAAVSEISTTKIRPERRHLAAHQLVIKALMENGTLLPMTFGMITNGRSAAMKLLMHNHEAFTQQLRSVSGKVEMGVRVSWDVPNIFEYFVIEHPELKQIRDRFWSSRNGPSRDDKINIGRIFDSLIKSDREKYAAKLAKILAPKCFDIRSLPVNNEREVVNLACLVKNNNAAREFETEIVEAAQSFNDKFVFQFNGPWAPHNFVELRATL